MSIVLPFPLQPKNNPDAGAYSSLPELPWWLEYASEGEARQYVVARLNVLRTLTDHRADPHQYNRAHLRDQIAGGVHLCAVKTGLRLELVIDDLAAAAELTGEEMAGVHLGRTPWRKRILREEKLARKAALRRRAYH